MRMLAVSNTDILRKRNCRSEAPTEMMSTTVFCLARDEVRAMRLLDELRAAGFQELKVSALVPEKALLRGFAALDPAALVNPEAKSSTSSVLLRGLGAQVSLLDPVIGRLIGAGPLLKDLNQSAPRPLEATLEKAGLRNDSAELYRKQMANGKILIGAQTNNGGEASRVEAVLGQAGAENLLVRSDENPGSGEDELRYAA